MSDSQDVSTRRVLAVALSLLALTLSGCPQASPQQPVPVGPVVKPETELRFDMRYYDSIEMTPRSPRTERELAIFLQLQRLQMAKPARDRNGKLLVLPKEANDSIYSRSGDGPLVGFANQAEELADIYRQIDSLKVLEHLPVTPR